MRKTQVDNFDYLPVLPGFTVKPPTSVVSRSNERVSVDCRATGNPEPTVKWVRNGVDFSSGVSGTKSDKTLVISSLNTTLQGNYTCTATNEIGDKASTHVFIGKEIYLNNDKCSIKAFYERRGVSEDSCYFAVR